MSRFRRSIALLLLVAALPLAMMQTTPASAAPVQHRYVVVLDDSVSDTAFTAQRQVSMTGAKLRGTYPRAIKAYTAEMSDAQARVLQRDSSVKFVAVERTYSKPKAPAKPLRCSLEVDVFTTQCLPDHLNRIDGEKSSTVSGDGKGAVDVNVAVIDSGIDELHPDLNVVGGIDCVTGSARVPASHTDEIGHGTFVAGVVGAKDNGFGPVGVAPGSNLFSVKVGSDQFDVSEASVLCGLDWVLGTRLDSDPNNDIEVANLSIGAPGADDGACGLINRDVLHFALCKVFFSGVTIVAAAGNDGGDLAQSIPAAYPQVLAATASSDFDGKPGGQASPMCFSFDDGQFGFADDHAAEFSNYAVKASDKARTLNAPGVCIASTVPGNGYAVGDGTSFSSPLVVGTAALCISTKRCQEGSPWSTMRTLTKDARDYNSAHPKYGFAGDPLRPVPGKYYGYLVNAGRQ